MADVAGRHYAPFFYAQYQDDAAPLDPSRWEALDPGALATSLAGFSKLGWAGIGVGVFFILISFLVKTWGHVGVDGTPHAEIDGDRQSMPH